MSDNQTVNLTTLDSDYRASRMEAELNGIKGREETTYHDRMLGHIESLLAIAQRPNQAPKGNQTVEGEVVE